VSEKASRWDLVVLELAAAEKVFRGLLYWFHDFREFIEAELGQTEPHGPHHPPGRAYPLGAPWCLVGPWFIIWSSPEASGVSFVQKKSQKSFVAFELHLVLIFYETKNKQKNRNWHWALI